MGEQTEQRISTFHHGSLNKGWWLWLDLLSVLAVALQRKSSPMQLPGNPAYHGGCQDPR
jgi:hypothetical protein